MLTETNSSSMEKCCARNAKFTTRAVKLNFFKDEEFDVFHQPLNPQKCSLKLSSPSIN